MEIILNSNEHKINDNCLSYYFKQPIRFINQNISLKTMIFYNFFPNINENFELMVKYNNSNLEIKFQNGSYNVRDISDIINLEIKENSNINVKEPIKLVVDINQYKILIIVQENSNLEFYEVISF